MIKPILMAAALSLAAATVAWALPVSQAPHLPPLSSTDLIQVGHGGPGHGGNKNYNNKHYNNKHYSNNHYNNKHYDNHYNYKHYNYKHGGRYYYGNRYWGHRYYYAPNNWQGLGCIVVGPVWYCP
jgi:hypothetical protein